MDMPLADEVQAQLGVFEEVLGSLESRLQPFLGQKASASISKMPPLERAQAQLALAQATAALFQLLLRANGVDPSDHESRKEQERLAQYGKKVRRAAAEKELRESRRSLEVNVAAVNRFISAAVPELTQEQRAALKAAGQAAGAAAAGQAAGGRKRQEREGGTSEAADAEGAAAAFLEEAMAELGGGEAAGGGQPVTAAAGAGQREQGKKKKARRAGK
ncbi:hypothetical protein ABPG77_005428 [Micractinium sp. CCAP 211/92]